MSMMRLTVTHSKYIAPQQVYDHVRDTFHDFVSMSIQHLVWEMGMRLLKTFPQMGEVWFVAQNRKWDTASEVEGEDAKVFMDPRPPFGGNQKSKLAVMIWTKVDG